MKLKSGKLIVRVRFNPGLAGYQFHRDHRILFAENALRRLSF